MAVTTYSRMHEVLNSLNQIKSNLMYATPSTANVVHSHGQSIYSVGQPVAVLLPPDLVIVSH